MLALDLSCYRVTYLHTPSVLLLLYKLINSVMSKGIKTLSLAKSTVKSIVISEIFVHIIFLMWCVSENLVVTLSFIVTMVDVTVQK